MTASRHVQVLTSPDVPSIGQLQVLCASSQCLDERDAVCDADHSVDEGNVTGIGSLVETGLS